MTRMDNLEDIQLWKSSEDEPPRSEWIMAEKINGEIPGFLLIMCDHSLKGFTHQLWFACVREKYRKRGILKSMLRKIPAEWNIWLIAANSSCNRVNIWEKCGFSFYKNITDMIIMNRE